MKFSVIMPCYNSAAYVETAIESILAQEYPDWELIAVNDGSTDQTLDILNEYARNDARIRVLSKDNGGYATAVNLGLDHVSGDYFLMMGSDDRLYPDLFRRIIEEIGSEVPDMIAFRTVRFIDGVSRGVDSTTTFQTKACLSSGLVARYVAEYPDHAGILFERDTSKCYKTGLLGSLRLFGRYGYDADGIFASLFAHKARSFMSIPVDGYKWTLRDDSVSATPNLPKNLDRLSNWRQFFEATEELREEEVTKYEVIYAKFFAVLAQETALAIRLRDTASLRALKQSIICIPGVLKRYKIKTSTKGQYNLLLLNHAPRIWIVYRKTRAMIGRLLGKLRAKKGG